MKTLSFNTLCFILACALTFTVGGLAGTATAQFENDVKFLIIVDDSGTIQNEKTFEGIKSRLWSKLQDLRMILEYQNAEIEVIVSSSGESVWSGTVKDLRNTLWRKGRAKALIADTQSVSNRCNDLSAAFATLNRSIKLMDGRIFRTVHIYVVSNLYHTGKNCSSFTKILYPNSPPEGLNVEQIVTQRPQIKTVSFFGVHAEQSDIWLSEQLEGLLAWKDAEEGRNFGFYTEAQSLQALEHLEGVPR